MTLSAPSLRTILLGLLFSVSLPATAQAPLPLDGNLVDSAVVTFDPKALDEMVAVQADLRDILAQVEIRAITYWSDGLRVKGYFVVPKKGEKLPCVIFNRGGSREFGALNDRRVAYFLARMASWGYVVAASNYRGNAGGEGQEEFGGSDVNDVLNLLPLLESLPQADPIRVGMVGWSRGGLMTSLALTRTDRIKAAVLGGGMYDAHRTIRERPEMETAVIAQLAPRYATEKTKALDARSPVLWAEKLNKKTPLLLLHGAADSRVNPREALDMASRLLDAGHPFRLVLFEGAEHGIQEHETEVDRLIKEWLDRFVRDLQPWAAPAR